MSPCKVTQGGVSSDGLELDDGVLTVAAASAADHLITSRYLAQHPHPNKSVDAAAEPIHWRADTRSPEQLLDAAIRHRAHRVSEWFTVHVRGLDGLENSVIQIVGAQRILP